MKSEREQFEEWMTSNRPTVCLSRHFDLPCNYIYTNALQDWHLWQEARRTAQREAAPDMLEALRSIKQFGELAIASATQPYDYPGGKLLATKEVWQFPRHLLTEIDAAIAKAEAVAPAEPEPRAWVAWLEVARHHPVGGQQAGISHPEILLRIDGIRDPFVCQPERSLLRTREVASQAAAALGLTVRSAP